VKEEDPMKLTLLDYQEDAVRDVLNRLSTSRSMWQEHQVRNAFALTATTGAGKTVIAAAVIEALLHGSDEFDVEPIPGATVLWISKDPALNAQTRHRFIQAADRIPIEDLVPLDKDFTHDRLQPGSVYFINPAKLSKNALFVRKTDTRKVTFWDIIDRTIKDPNLTLFLVLDEAHEGVQPIRKADLENNQTTVLKIINGNGSNEPVPIVWGISATATRFKQAMSAATNRGTLPDVWIDPKRVQASGLIKKTLTADIPDEIGEFDTTFVRNAVREFDAVCERWAAYAESEGLEKPVRPLLVVQIPNKSSNDADFSAEDALIQQYLDVVRGTWNDFDDECVAHVLGDRGLIEAGPYTVPRIAPEDIQDDVTVRVLIAKDAISTGWDCPRAETLVSLRPGNDHTYITQLLGRMVRTPLARETSDDRLNSASVYLPKFNREQAETVVKEIMGLKDPSGAIIESEGGGPRVLFKPVDLSWNSDVPEEVRDLIQTLPSLPKPAADPKPIKRLLAAAVAFAQDGLVEKANDKAHDHLMAALDGIIAEYADQVATAAEDIKSADIRKVSGTLGLTELASATAREDADIRTVDDALRVVRRALSASLVNRYLKRKYHAAILIDLMAPLIDVRAEVAALARIDTGANAPTVVRRVEDAADGLLKTWLQQHRAAIRALPDSRRAEYDRIRAKARDVEQVDTELKTDERVDTVDRDGKPLRKARKHVLADADGDWPVEEKVAANSWEMRVLIKELGSDLAGDTNPNLVGWYRNPSTAGTSSLRIAYLQDGVWRSCQPDFVFIERDTSGALRPSILDPHGTQLADAMPKLLALAAYAEHHGDQFLRIDSMAAIDKPKPGEDVALRIIDMLDPDIRDAVRAAAATNESAEALFKAHGVPYA
jgi:type III restriction enzyme